VAAAVAVGRPVAQQFVGADARERSGQLSVRTGVLRRRRALLSASITPRTIATQLQQAPPAGAQARTDLEQLADALAVFGTAGYGRPTELEGATLSTTLEHAVPVIQRIRRRTLWPIERGASRAARARLGARDALRV
jgi:hypothetical protein